MPEIIGKLIGDYLLFLLMGNEQKGLSDKLIS